MKAEIRISGLENLQKETGNEKQRIGSCGNDIDTGGSYCIGFSIQTGSCFVCVRCGPVRKRRDNVG